MADVTVQLRNALRGSVQEADLPSDVPMHRLATAIAAKLGAPILDDEGNPVSYRLSRGREILDDQLTLQQAGVDSGVELTFFPEMTPGRGPA